MSFFGSGMIGEYSKYFSEDQTERLGEKYKREFEDTLLYHCWDRYDKLPSVRGRSAASVGSIGAEL